MFDNRRIAFMDSGFGGITVLSEAIKLLPNENFLFYGDNGNMPYGEKSDAEIRKLVLNAFDVLKNNDVKAIVIACNTATSVAVDEIRAMADMPVLSVEPAIKPAIDNCDGTILMLATNATINQSRYKKLKKRLDINNQIIDVACLEWAKTIEDNIADNAVENNNACDLVIQKRLEKFAGEKIDAVVLGCTHFPLIKDKIAAYISENMIGNCDIYDGGRATASQLKRVLKESEIFANRQNEGNVVFLTSGDESDIANMKKVLVYCQGQ